MKSEGQLSVYDFLCSGGTTVQFMIMTPDVPTEDVNVYVIMLNWS
jgi:hypothetical protein